MARTMPGAETPLDQLREQIHSLHKNQAAGTLPDSAVTIDDLCEQIRALHKQIDGLKGKLARVEAERADLKDELRQQNALADEYVALVEQLDDLFEVRLLPTPLRLTLAEFGRAIGARAVIFG
jgi:chromosome segregation ATPase